MENYTTVALPATCGELVQGALNGIPCLVSCPIDRYSVAKIRLLPEPSWQFPHDTPKAVAALRAGLSYLDREGLGGQLWLETDIPRGRGYGSSTADVGATLFALGAALEQPLSAAEASQLALSVEPSDSTLFPGLALFDHREGTLFQEWGAAPPLKVVVLDPGGMVDTLAFNQLDHRENLIRLAPIHQEAFALLHDGLMKKDWRAIGEAATLSTLAHENILPNPLLEIALALAHNVGALGVCRAHSGTILGLLLDPTYTDVQRATNFIANRIPYEVSVSDYLLVDGGPRYQNIPNPQHTIKDNLHVTSIFDFSNQPLG